jgi:hypothetical protein
MGRTLRQLAVELVGELRRLNRRMADTARTAGPNATTVRHGDHTGAGDRESAGVGVTEASCRQQRARGA